MALTILDEQLESIQLSAEVREKALPKAKEGYVMTLLEVGEISSGKAGKILGVSRLEVIEMMKKWGISLFDDSQDLEELRQEVEQAETISVFSNSRYICFPMY
jgi:predicted HTH domain antitoxin